MTEDQALDGATIAGARKQHGHHTCKEKKNKSLQNGFVPRVVARYCSAKVAGAAVWVLPPLTVRPSG
jgi:hypothetical protein